MFEIVTSFNNTNTYNGIAQNNNTTTNLNIYLSGQSTTFNEDDLPAIKGEVILDDSPSIEDQNALNIEVFPNDQKIVELIWKHLSTSR